MTVDELRAAIAAEKDLNKKADLQTQLRLMGGAIPATRDVPVVKPRP